MTRKFRKPIFGLLVALALLGVAEGLVRLRERWLTGSFELEQDYFIGFNHRDWPIYEAHPYLGRSLKPGSQARYRQYLDSFDPVGPRGYVPATIHINGLGFRGPEVTLKKPPGVYRIACLGASTVFGIGVTTAEDRTWPACLETLLNADGAQPRPRFEVINAAVGGYNSAELLIRLSLQVVDLAPDLLIVNYANNDIYPATSPTNFRSDYAHSRRRNLPEPSRLVALLEHSLIFLKLRVHIVTGLRQAASLDEAPTPVWDPAGLEAYRRNYRSLIALAQAHGAQVLVATESLAFDERTPPAEAERRARHPNNPYGVGLIQIHGRYNAAALELARELGLPAVDLQALLPKEGRYFKDRIHLTDEGNRAVAGIIAQAVRVQVLRR